MIALDATNQTLEIATSSGANIDYAVSWVDTTVTAFTPGSGHGTVAAATTTTIVTAPAASTQRGIKHLSLRNRHASTSQTVTVKKNVASTLYQIASAVLAAGETLIYEDSAGWQLYNATGQMVTSGATGATGAAGVGVPAGGSINQVLAKVDGTDFNTYWMTAAAGGGDDLLTWVGM